MASGDAAVTKLCDDEALFAIRDINPRAPLHVLVIPKQHIDDASALDGSHGITLTRMFAAAREITEQAGLMPGGYRLTFNVGEAAGMTIPHLHLHVLGGRHLGPEG